MEDDKRNETEDKTTGSDSVEQLKSWLESQEERAETEEQPEHPDPERERRRGAGFLANLKYGAEERALAREERARLRRSRKQTARLVSDQARAARIARIERMFSRFRERWARAREHGIVPTAIRYLAQRRMGILGICIVMILSGLLGAFAMRARHRRYLIAPLVAVNGSVIRRSDLNDELYETYGDATLDMLTERELRRQFLKAQGAEATDKQVEDRYRLEAKIPEFFSTLSETHQTEQQYRESLKRVLSEMNLVTKGITVSDAEVREYYRRNADPRNIRGIYYKPPFVQLAVIATPTKPAAEQAIRELRAGKPFSTVASKYSLHDSATNGGLLPAYYLGRSMTMHALGIDQLAKNLEANRQIGPAKLGNMWWIVRCIGRKPARRYTFEEVRETSELLVRNNKGNRINAPRFAKAYAEFKESARIQHFGSR